MEKQKAFKEIICDLERQNVHLHGAVLLEHGEPVGEYYNAPFTKDSLHRMYSVTKSFVSCAVGMAIDRGKLQPEEPVFPYFQQEFSLKNPHPYIQAMTVRDLLMMSAPFDTLTYGEGDTDWLKSMFTATPSHPSGTLYRYDSGATYVLASLVKRVFKKDFVEVLRPVFDALEMSKDIHCLKGPDDELWAGSGLLMTTMDLAKFCNLLVQGGKHNDTQWISEHYVKEATKKQIVNYDDGDPSLWLQGYGYQIWCMPDDAFFFNGMGGQLAIGFPNHNAVFACTADLQGHSYGKEIIYNTLWQRLAVPFYGAAYRQNREEASVNHKEQIDGAWYALCPNPSGFERLSFRFSDDGGVMTYVQKGEEKEIPFGFSEEQPFLFPDLYNGDILFAQAYQKRYQCLAKGTFTEPHKLQINVRAVDDYVGNITMVFSFKDNAISIKMHKNAQFFFHGYHGFFSGQRTE